MKPTQKRVPFWVWLEAHKTNPYGSVPDLPDEELADPRELERQAFIKDWGPILALPVRGSRMTIRPAIDEDGDLNWGAFGTVDFERYAPTFDRTKYKLGKLTEQWRDLKIRIDTVRHWVRAPEKHLVFKHALSGVLALEDILDEELREDVRELLRLYRRMRAVWDEIQRLREARRKRKEREVAAMFARWS